MKLSKQQQNVLAALRQSHTAKRRWLPVEFLNCYDGRTVDSLIRKGLIEVNADYGVRVVK